MPQLKGRASTQRRSELSPNSPPIQLFEDFGIQILPCHVHHEGQHKIRSFVVIAAKEWTGFKEIIDSNEELLILLLLEGLSTDSCG